MKHEEKMMMRYVLLLSCVKRGYISIKKASRKLDWSIQKVVATGQLLCEKGILTKKFTEGFVGDTLIGYELKKF